MRGTCAEQNIGKKDLSLTETEWAVDFSYHNAESFRKFKILSVPHRTYIHLWSTNTYIL